MKFKPVLAKDFISGSNISVFIKKQDRALCKLVMLLAIYKLQMLVGSVTAWQLGLCLVYFSAAISLDDDDAKRLRVRSFFFFFSLSSKY